MAWNVADNPKGRELLDRLAPEGPELTPSLTERLPQRLQPNTTDTMFVAAGCRIVTRLNEVATLTHGLELQRLFEQNVHSSPPDRPHSYIYPMRHQPLRTPLPEGHVPITQQGTGYFYSNTAEFDATDAEGAVGVIASTMNAKEGGVHSLVGRMCAIPETATQSAPRSQRRSVLMLSAPH